MDSKAVAYFAMNLEEYTDYMGAVVRGDKKTAAKLGERAGMSDTEIEFVLKRQSQSGVEAARNFIGASNSW